MLLLWLRVSPLDLMYSAVGRSGKLPALSSNPLDSDLSSKIIQRISTGLGRRPTDFPNEAICKESARQCLSEGRGTLAVVVAQLYPDPPERKS
jgi:hypothetical protein